MMSYNIRYNNYSSITHNILVKLTLTLLTAEARIHNTKHVITHIQ